MTMQVGMVGADGLVLVGDTRRYVEPRDRDWYSYSSSKIKIADSGRIAIACARNMDISLRIAQRIFSELPSFTSIQDREHSIWEIGMDTTRNQAAECIIAFADPTPSLYVFLCDGNGDGRCEEVDRISTGNTGNPAYFLAERYYTSLLSVAQLMRLAANIIVAAGTLNSGAIQGLEVVTLNSVGFRQWSREENRTLENEAKETGRQIGELILGAS
jgi:20S proteasome alpha/beta subunit